MNNTVRFFVTAVAIVFLCAAFAGKAFAAPDAAAKEIVLTIKNHMFEPATVEAPAGEKLTLRVVNQDDSAEEFESHDLKREKIVPAKGEITVSVGPLKPGSYAFFGEFHEATAKGTLVVK